MMFYQQVPHFRPGEDVKCVFSFRTNLNEDHNEMLHRTSFASPDDLAPALEGNLTISRDVAELPRRAATGFDLDGDMLAALVGCNDVIVRHITGESRRDVSTTGQFSGDKIFSGLSNKLIAASCCHFVPVTICEICDRYAIPQTRVLVYLEPDAATQSVACRASRNNPGRY